MAMFYVEATARWWIDEREPDGSECELCGDACLLWQYELLIDVWVGGKLVSRSTHISVLCRSCRDSLEDDE